MNTYAQTNLQLYGQLLSAGRPEQEVRLIRDTYELALGLFAAQYRGNGKPFVSHLVGVASILTAHWQPIETIAAGLLHSVYSFGEFGDGTRGADQRKREEVRKTVGAVVEDLVLHYSKFDWKLLALRELGCRGARLDATQKAVLAIKAADVIEDHLDRGLEYIPHKHFVESTENRGWMETLVDVTHQAGHTALATEMQTITTQHSASQLPEFLVTARAGSFLAPPRSHRKRMLMRVNRKLSRLLRTRAA